MPYELARVHADTPDLCLRLPPSLELGEVYIDSRTSKRYAQPNISYHLRTSVEYITGETGMHHVGSMWLPVPVAPSTSAFPPTQIDDFPTDFQERVSIPFRKNFATFTSGQLTASLQEPLPMAYNSSTGKSSTQACLRLEFIPASDHMTSPPPSGLKFTVSKLVRMKTFYSVRPFPGMPSQNLVGHSPPMHDAILDLGKHCVVDILWIYTHLGVGRVPSHATSSREKSGGQPGQWVAEIALPIETRNPLIPTFCSALVARVYTICLRIRVPGAYCGPMDLEVPLQVVSSPLPHPPPYERDASAICPAGRASSESSAEGQGRGFTTSHLSMNSTVSRFTL